MEKAKQCEPLATIMHLSEKKHVNDCVPIDFSVPGKYSLKR